MAGMHDFPVEEYESRWTRARTYMAQHGLNGIVVTQPEHYRYLSGARFRTLNRPFVFILPLEGEPLLVCSRSLETTVPHFSYVQQLVCYDQPFTADVAVRALQLAGLHRGRIGVEVGMLIGSPLPPLLASALPEVDWVDTGPLLWHLRAVKSQTELVYIQKACDMLGDVFLQFARGIRPGMTEKELARQLKHLFIENGADEYTLMLNGGGSRLARATVLTDTPFAPGQHLWVDSGCSHKGYWSDFARVFVWGEMPPAHARKWEVVRAITENAIAKIRPGQTLAEIHSWGRSICGELGADPAAICGVDDASRVHLGHGVGLTRNELPEIGPWDQTVTVPGMTLTIEPGYINEEGVVHTEEHIVVTENGCRVLSTSLPALVLLDR